MASDPALSEQAEPTRGDAVGAFDGVVCGVDGRGESDEAVRQAALLAAPGARVLVVSVADEIGVVGCPWRPPLGPAEAGDAVVRATRLLADAAVDAQGVVERHPGVDSLLLRLSDTEDLLAVAASADPRLAGLGLGRVPAALVRRARASLLVARRPPQGTTFPLRMLVAGGRRTVEVARAIARPHRSHVALLPARLTDRADSARTIVDRAASASASLIVVGGPVAERPHVAADVARWASCSVLIVRPPRGERHAASRRGGEREVADVHGQEPPAVEEAA